MTMNTQPPLITAGTAFLCDTRGIIQSIIRDELNISDIIPLYHSFPTITDKQSFPKALNFLVELQSKKAAFGWELNIPLKGKVKKLVFGGAVMGDSLLILCAENNETMMQLYEEMVRINNEQANVLRTTVKKNVENEAAFPSGERLLYDDMSKLNNELANLQRELVKKNAELQKANEIILELTRTDPLTEIANRRYFVERFEEALSQAQRHGRSLSLNMCDLDHFKAVNDTYGHDTGDIVLKSFASLLRISCRREDIPARFGGEEFVILLPETAEAEAVQCAERINHDFRYMDILKKNIFFTVSIGTAQMAPDDTCASLLKKADQALYVSKKTGRNRVTLWNPDHAAT